jgi:hypothetical protein
MVAAILLFAGTAHAGLINGGGFRNVDYFVVEIEGVVPQGFWQHQEIPTGSERGSVIPAKLVGNGTIPSAPAPWHPRGMLWPLADRVPTWENLVNPLNDEQFGSQFLGVTPMTEAINVPEPSSLALLGVGLLGISLARRRRKAA